MTAPISENPPLLNLSGYRTIEQLYAGSRTLVYRAVQLPTQRPVIIKVLRAAYPSFNELVQFRNQYAITKNLNIPGIIRPLSLETWQNGYALVMEDTGSVSLAQYSQHQPLSLSLLLPIALQMAEILHQLHAERVIHKDIKPANILIQPETMQVQLIDFSISSLLPKQTQEIQNPNILEGTLAYLSPEQTGRMNRAIDYRSDFYSLGITLFECLAGQLPFQSSDAMELVHSHIAQQPPSLVQFGIPEVIAAIVGKSLAKNAEDRYQSALGLKYDLEKCWTQLQESGKLEAFEIGKRDIGERFIIPERLYGREAEVHTLLAAFERVAGGASELMLVAGFSGIGKTAVVNEIHKPIVRQKGYFIKGKFDQFQRNIPFSAFVQAFRDLMRQLLSESDAQLQLWKAKILSAVGENGQVLIEVIPELEQIVGTQPAAPELSGSAAQNRFNLLMQKFVKIFTSIEHPLVIFLDDLQWADSASLKLLQFLMQDTANLLILGAYRNNEVFPAHPLILTVDELVKMGAAVNTITLSPLSLADLNQLVSDTLNCDARLALPLTELVYQKTQGNPFFATQFLKALHDDKLIEFNKENQHWQCDIARVKALAMTDNVVEFVAMQLQKLPTETQETLKLAACIGAEFDLDTLAIVSEKSDIETATMLWKALQEGLILPTSEIYKFYIEQTQLEQNLPFNTQHSTLNYKFLHDRVQQAAYSLIPSERKQTTHYQIGKLLLQKIPPESREDRIFELVNQLNYGTTLIVQQNELDELVQLNLIASRKARSATAYQASREYTNFGLSLLGEKAWQQQYELTLEFHELAAELAFLCGDFETMDRFVEIAIEQAHTLLEKVNIYLIKIQFKASQSQLDEGLALGIDLLRQLGISMTELPTMVDVQQSIQEISELIGSHRVEDFANLPVMTDANKIAITQIANSIMGAAYTCGSLLYPLLTTLLVKLSLQYGNTSVSASNYACYSLVLSNIQKNIDLAAEFGQLALNLTLKSDNKATKPEVFLLLGGFILHRKSHIKETLSFLEDGYKLGLEMGNLEYAGYCGQSFCRNSFYCGLPLSDLEQDTRTYYHALVELKQLGSANYCLIYWQMILNLLGFAARPTVLSITALQEAEFLLVLRSANDWHGLYIFYTYKLTLCFLFGEIEEANNHALECRSYFMGGASTVGEPAFYLYDSLVAIAQLTYRSSEVSTILERVEQNQTLLQQWAHHAPMNYQHKYDLVEAEKYRILEKHYQAGDYYDRAIAGAKANEYIQEEALANELAAKFYLDWGREKAASGYMQEAYYCYAKWGAKAKIDDLERLYSYLLRPILQQTAQSITVLETLSIFATSTYSSHSTHSQSSSRNSLNNSLDLATLLQVSQAISSTIQLDELLENLTQTMRENSGAEKCALILSQDDRWQVRVIADLTETRLQQVPLENHSNVPVKLIQYVKNTLEILLIEDIQTDLPSLIDDYLHECQPKSILCLPLLERGNLVGILYLENRSTSGVFSHERVLVLNFLCTQAAISLENARLYRKAQDYAQQIEQSQLQLVQSEKMSALGNLVAGIAHEINNPVGFISGNIVEALASVKDITEFLQLYRETFPNASNEIEEKAEELDIEYLLEDLPKMLVSMQVGCERIQGISKSIRIFSRADEDKAVLFNIHEGINSTLFILKHRLKANSNRPEIQVITNYGKIPKIQGFPGQLNQVFMNILVNAIEALEEESAGCSFTEIQQNPNRIVIRTRVENGEVKITIADNGIGMSEEVKQKIFNHLFTTKAVGQGTGLGLAIARQIVEEKHGGRLSVQSELGRGTEFCIHLRI